LAWEGANVTSTDLNGPRLEAVEKYQAYGFANKIRCEAVNALDIPYTEAFDIVVFKSILGVIGDPCTKATQAAAIGQIYKALRPGGELYFAENLAASPIHRFLRRKFVGWGTTWRYPSMEEVIQYLDVFPSVQFGTFGVTGVFGRTESQRSMLATVDHAVFDRVLPSHWKYIIAGVARK
jgi:SAM-dependent methyltransferase